MGDGDDVIIATVSVFLVNVVSGEDARIARLDILRLGQIVGTAGHIRGEDHNILQTEVCVWTMQSDTKSQFL